MIKKINLIGNNFHYTMSSSAFKKPKYLEWVHDNSGILNFYLDGFISSAFSDRSNLPKYAWIIEPKDLQQNIYNDVKNNLDNYINEFEMIFSHDEELISLHEKIKPVIGGFWIKKPKIHSKNKLISMISSNKNFLSGHSKRLEWIEKLRNKVDLFGKGFNEIEYKEDGLNDYMFSVAVENTEYSHCISEKILDCFATGTIPVYLGSPSINNFFNEDGIIKLTDHFEISPEIYYSKKYAIEDNLERVLQYEITEDYIYNNYLKEKID